MTHSKDNSVSVEDSSLPTTKELEKVLEPLHFKGRGFDAPCNTIVDLGECNCEVSEALVAINKVIVSERLDAEIESNEAWKSLDRPIDPREFVLEIGRLELEKQKQQSLTQTKEK